MPHYQKNRRAVPGSRELLTCGYRANKIPQNTEYHEGE